jgi:hypothetical protein
MFQCNANHGSTDYDHPSTPPSEPSSPAQEAHDFTSRTLEPRSADEEEQAGDERAGVRKKDRYDSRIEQLLHENPDLAIQITYAGKNLEGGGSYIAYTIRTGVGQSHFLYYTRNSNRQTQDVEVRRRYSDFFSLRETLVKLHPTLIIPPIPEKHSMADYH